MSEPDPNVQVFDKLNQNIEQNSATTTYTFDENASPEAKKAQALATVAPGVLQSDKKTTGIVTELLNSDANDVAKAVSQAQAKPTNASATVESSSTSASATPTTPTKVPGSYPVHPGGILPDWYKVGWTAFSGPKKQGDEEEFIAKRETDMLADFLNEAYYGEWWHNAGAFIITVIFTWVIARFGGGLGACLVIGAFLATYYQTSIRRLRRNVRDDLQREVAKVRIETEEESADWINTFLSRFWLIYEPVLSASIIQTVDQVLSESTPAFLDSIRLTTFTLGTKPPRIESVRSYPKTEPDVVVMDWRFSFTPNDILDLTRRELQNKVNPKIVLMIRVGKGFVGAGMPILLEDMAFSGHIQLRFKLMSQFPHVKTLEASFLSEPTFDYSLKPVGGETLGFDINIIPGLAPFIRDQVHATLRPMMYAPNVFTVDVEAIMSGAVQIDSAIGVLVITVYSASGLKNSDMIGTSDPYVKFHINNRPELGRTTVKEDATNPQWNETKFLLLTSLNDILSLEVMDKNAGRKDKSMGVANFDLKGLADDETKHEGLNLTILRNGKSAGELKVDMMYFPVAQPTKLEDGTLQPAPESNSGILRFTIHGCQDLDASKSLVGQYNPYTVLNVNGEEKWRTRRIKRTNNPSWEKSYEMLVIDKTQTNLTVDVKDDREFVDDPIVGTWSMPLLELFNNLEKKRDWFQLKNCSSGKIHVSATWKSVFLTGVGDKMGHGVYSKPIGVVRVKFHAARDLKNVEAVTGGKSDPYVRIMSGVQIRTRTEIIDNNLNPVWNEVHYVPVHSMKESLVLEVLDWNHMSKDKSLGATELDVRKLAKEVKESEGESGNMKIWYECMETIDKWAPLLSVDGKSSKGELHYEASFFPTLKLAREETKREQEEEIKGETPNTSIGVQNEDGIRRPPGIDIRGEAIKMAADGSVDLAAYESGVFAVTIHEAIFGKRVSVFAEILLDSNDAQFKTVLSKGTQLTFEETGDAFVKELDFSRVVIRLRHHREMEEDGIIGEWASKVKDLVREYAEQQVEELKRGGSATAAQGQWYQLQNSEISGKLRLSFQYTPVTKFKLDPSESMENQGNLVVTVLKASKVMAADRGGTSDPYIVLSLNGEKVHKTETVKKTLDPIFSNEQFTIPVPSRTGADFRFEIFDWNQVQQAKSLGGGIIPLGGDHVQSFVSVEKEFQITGVPGASGTLRLRLLWQPELLARKKTSTVLGGATRVLTSAPGAVLGGTKAMVGGGAHLAGEGVQLGGKILGGGLRASGSVLSSGIGLMSGKKKKNSSSDDIPAPLLVEGSVAIPNVSQPQQSISTEPVTTTSQPVHVSESQESDERNTARASVDIPESLPRGSIGDFNPNDATGVSGALVVTFMEAKGLKAADRGGTSDPFVRLRVGKKEVFKTQHIKKTLSPTWNESYTLSVTGSPLTLDIKVKDHNTFGGDVDLGEHELKLWELVHPVAGQMSTYDSWLPLSPSGSGEIRVKLEFTPGAEVDEADEGGKNRLARGFTALRKK